MITRQSTEDGTPVVFFEEDDMPVFCLVYDYNELNGMFVVLVPDNYIPVSWSMVEMSGDQLFYA